jgi:hypothetical protein
MEGNFSHVMRISKLSEPELTARKARTSSTILPDIGLLAGVDLQTTCDTAGDRGCTRPWITRTDTSFLLYRS